MRYLVAGAAALILASQATAQFPSNVHTRAAPGSGFDITHLLSGLFPSTTSSSSRNQPLPIARPQQLPPRNTGLANFLPKIRLPAASPVLGLSQYPTEAQMPGAAYLRAFGARVAPRVPIN